MTTFLNGWLFEWTNERINKRANEGMDAWVKKQTKERKKQPNEGMNVERIANIYLLTLTPIERGVTSLFWLAHQRTRVMNTLKNPYSHLAWTSFFWIIFKFTFNKVKKNEVRSMYVQWCITVILQLVCCKPSLFPVWDIFASERFTVLAIPISMWTLLKMQYSRLFPFLCEHH